MPSLLQPLRDIPIACIDVETTGASAELGERIIEVGIARIEGGRIVAQYEQLVDPQRRVSPGVTVLTGITQDMVAGKPTFAEQLAAMLPLLHGAAILGHNVRFDLSFLIAEFRRIRRDIAQVLPGAHVLDTVRMARRRFGRGGNGLQQLCHRLGYQPFAAHRALPDAITTVNVFDRLIEPVGGWRLPLCDAIQQQGGPMELLPSQPQPGSLPLELEEALENRCPVVLEYLDAEHHRSRRVIEPIGVRRYRGELILTAHCQLRNDQRNFKIDRIVRLTRVGDLQPDAAMRVSGT